MKIKLPFTLALAAACCLSAGAQLRTPGEPSPADKLEMTQRRLVQNHLPAPAFTLPDLDGKSVSLSDFKGKWVVLDFWGSWCVWCIRGIPDMKTTYSILKDKGVEFIGIDCNDPEEKWRAAVERYDLPWVNLYNSAPGGGRVTQEYGVQGFPTKAIIDPEGKVYTIITGEDPMFYQILFEAVGVEKPEPESDAQ